MAQRKAWHLLLNSEHERTKMYLYIVYLYISSVQCFFIGNEFSVGERLPKDFSRAIVDIAAGLPTKAITIVRGNSTNIRTDDIFHLMYALNNKNIAVVYIDFLVNNSKSTYYAHQRKGLDTSEERTSFILCEVYECENIISELKDINLIHRSMLYIFYWEHGAVSKKFRDSIEEAMRVVVITRRKHVYRIYYNQAIPDLLYHLSLVNWWSGQLYKYPVLPPADKVYKNFRGRVFNVPVLHAPPWHFVTYKNNSSVNVTGGRDDKLLALLAMKLNFRYKYYDPPVRSQGSMISGNGTFRGVLGLIWKRQADFFLGDVTITWERLQAVEFSFLTLADSAAFLTHAPDKLSETLVIIRPFQWQVWPLVCATLVVIGPALWLVTAAPTCWQRRRRNLLQQLNECCWYTTTLFLRQTPNKEPSRSNKARLVSILISLGATYVIGDMYSANLTSLMARPAKEQPIGTLEALEEAMRERGYELVIEKHSSTLTILQNGTGVYGSLAHLMKRQRIQRVRSLEVGVRMVLSRRLRIAVLGGRETLYYDTERFGSHNFHLSEKLYTRYSAIALQIGCPYSETFNNVVMTLFEAGILTKMTTDEYKNLPKASRRSEKVTESDNKENSESGEIVATAQTQSESTIGLEPVSLTILRGAFCLLGVGYLAAAVVLCAELQVYKGKKSTKSRVAGENDNYKIARRVKMFLSRQVGRFIRAIYRYIDNALGPIA